MEIFHQLKQIWQNYNSFYGIKAEEVIEADTKEMNKPNLNSQGGNGGGRGVREAVKTNQISLEGNKHRGGTRLRPNITVWGDRRRV